MKKSNEESIMDIINKLREIDYINPEYFFERNVFRTPIIKHMGERGEDFLDVADRQDIFKVVQKDQEKHRKSIT